MVFAVTELFLSLLLVISLGANFIFPHRAGATAGISQKLSYQGRLTDLSGNPLGGAGTNYCFKFSIYDSAAAGAKVWPAGAPTSTTVLVKDGVFNTAIGDADTLTYDFTQYDILYLDVQINDTATACSGNWEPLSSRQRIDAVGYAQAAKDVYSSILRAQSSSSPAKVQIGIGSGTNPPVVLGLDWKNANENIGDSCINGQMWYNSIDSKARVCEGNTLKDIVEGVLVKDEGTDVGYASAGLNFVGAGVSASLNGTAGVIQINVPFGGVAVNGTAAGTVSAGSVVFSNSNNVSFGMNGSTITATAAGGYTNSDFTPYSPNLSGLAMSASSLGQNTLFFMSFFLPHEYYALRLNLYGSVTGSIAGAANTGSAGYTQSVALYARNPSEQREITKFWSGSAFISIQNSSNSKITAVHPAGIANSTSVSSSVYTSNATNASTYVLTSIYGVRQFVFPLSSTLTVGQYWLAFAHSYTSVNASDKLSLSVMYQSMSNSVIAFQPFGTNSSATNLGKRVMQGIGTYSATSNAFPASVTLSKGSFAWNTAVSFPFFNFSGWTTGTDRL
ncbi:MAG: hypothetical protein CEN90_689 [Parcubacteria group bacterium Licking1014_17]|nr:MAG: hypothetical protein CEN90_689 [Parcubacteria group bacterium Licking1014_17]